MKRLSIFIVAAVALLLLFVLGTVFYKDDSADRTSQRIESNASALIRAHSPTLGSPDAPVQIVEFLDPACETCAAFYPLVKDMMAANPGRIRLVLRWAPFHKDSDQVVAMLEAARRQGKLWPALEALLGSQGRWVPRHVALPELARRQLDVLGLDRERLLADAADAQVAGLIRQDLADAQTLGVTKTPEFFVNGKPLPSFGYPQLKQLVDEALLTAARR